MRRKEITMQDIAEQLGISKVTVSKALNNKDGVSEELRKKVKEVARRFTYEVPNSNLKQDIQRNIAIIVREKYVEPKKYVPFYFRLYQKLASELNTRGYMCNLFTVSNDQQKDIELPKLFLEYPMSGIVVIGNINKSYVKALKNLNIPIIFLDCYDSENNIDCILTDNYYSTYEITNHLLKNGHRRIGFVGNIGTTSSIQDRFLGYYRSLLEAQLPMNMDWVISDRDEDNEEVDFTLPYYMPTAFVCNCDDTAYKFIRHLKKKGYSVPEEISIVGFDNDIYAEISEPKLTTVSVDINTMAEKAANRISDKIQLGLEEKQTRLFVTGNIIYRDSVKRIEQE